ncbi:MAG: hypothetical protein ACTSP7_08045 [Candidatus Heimdallarchaeota archaeon]
MSRLKLLKKSKINAFLLLVILSSLIFSSFTSKHVSGAPFDDLGFKIKVLFDESHQPYYGISGLNPAYIRNDGYRFFSSYLEENNYDLDVLNTSSVINEAVLQYYDIFIICASQTQYSNVEIDAIYDWTINGGSLLLLGEYGGYSNGIKGLARKFGYLFFDDRLRESVNSYGNTNFAILFNESNMFDDDLFTNVTSLVLTSITGHILKPENSEEVLFTDDDGTIVWGSTWSPAGNIPILSKNMFGDNKNGKIVVCCDSTLWDSDDNELNGGSSWDELDNAQFALNIMDWLAASTSNVGIPFMGFSLSLSFSMFILVFIRKRYFKKKKINLQSA